MDPHSLSNASSNCAIGSSLLGFGLPNLVRWKVERFSVGKDRLPGQESPDAIL